MKKKNEKEMKKKNEKEILFMTIMSLLFDLHALVGDNYREHFKKLETLGAPVFLAQSIDESILDV